MVRYPEGRFEWVLLLVLVTGLFVTVFDLAKKTVFLGASWNYQYPAFSFVYNVPATVALVALVILTVVAVPRLLALDHLQFVTIAFVGAFVLYGLSFLVLPEKSAYHALTPDKAMYCASLEAANNGILVYLDNFHKIGHCPAQTGFTPSAGRVSYIENGTATIQSWFLNATWFPWHEGWANYASNIGEQKHGPIPPLLAAGALVVIGQSPISAAVLNYVMGALLAPLAYLTLRELFDEEPSRAVTLMFMFTPAIFIYVRKHVVAYDTHTAVFVFASVVLFTRAVTRRSLTYAAVAGVGYSLAFLSKVTALPVVVVFLIISLTSEAPFRESLARLVSFSASALVLPVTLLLLGYNAIVQFVYQFALHADLNKGGILLAQTPNPDLGNPIINLLAASYHFRLFSIPALLLLAVFIGWSIQNRNHILSAHRYHYALAFLVPIIPFTIWKLGLNLGRQLLPYFVGITLLAVSGLALTVANEPRARRVILYRAAIATTATISLINL